MTARRLPRSFYDRPALDVARDLLGKHLVHLTGGAHPSIRSGRIVETEAYVSAEDLACHAAKGLTPRTRVIFGPPGRAYVFFIYGIHHCFNVVCERDGFPAAVLVRALEPGDGIAASHKTDGPGKLCTALGITRAENGADLVDGDLYLEDRGEPPVAAVATPRIGIDYAGDWIDRPYRFVDPASAWLSKKLPRPRSPATAPIIRIEREEPINPSDRRSKPPARRGAGTRRPPRRR